MEVYGIMKYSTCTWDLVWALESAFPASCKTPAAFIDFFRPKNEPEISKEPRKQIQLPTNRIVLPCCTYTENIHSLSTYFYTIQTN